MCPPLLWTMFSRRLRCSPILRLINVCESCCHAVTIAFFSSWQTWNFCRGEPSPEAFLRQQSPSDSNFASDSTSWFWRFINLLKNFTYLFRAVCGSHVRLDVWVTISHYHVVRDSPGGAILSNKMGKFAHYTDMLSTHWPWCVQKSCYYLW